MVILSSSRVYDDDNISSSLSTSLLKKNNETKKVCNDDNIDDELQKFLNHYNANCRYVPDSKSVSESETESENESDTEKQKLRDIGRKIFFDIIVKQKQPRQGSSHDEYDGDELVMENKDTFDCLKTIVVMDDDTSKETRKVLHTFHGKLCTVNELLLQNMLPLMPEKQFARVADFNDNISYSMLEKSISKQQKNNRNIQKDQEQGGQGNRQGNPYGGGTGGLLKMFQQHMQKQKQPSKESSNLDASLTSSLPIEEESLNFQKYVLEFEETLKMAVDGDVEREVDGDVEREEIQYQGSFLRTEDRTIPQPAHVDFSWDYLDSQQQEGNGKNNISIGFFPLTKEGMFLQFWENSNNEQEQGTVLFIPYGKLLIVPANTIHGGGFRTSALGNPRFHLYLSCNGKQLPAHQTNKYTEPTNKSKVLSERLVDSETLFASKQAGKGGCDLGLMDILFE